MEMEKRLENLRWRPRWVSHLGCVKGCLEYLKLDVSEGWLFGATGYAFIINIHEVICPSGPTAWRTEMLFKLGENIGYSINGVWGVKSDADFGVKQEKAWENTRGAIDQEIPCYGWELGIPEYYVVFGYDEEGYYFSGPGCDFGNGPKPWRDLGSTEIGVLEMYSLKKGEASDDKKTIRDALGFALEHSKSPEKWIYPKYKAGLVGFDNWIKALETGKASGFGMAYNSAVWGECRRFAVEFLKEAKNRLDKKLDSLFDQATEHYEKVAHNLNRASELFPFPPKGNQINDAERCRTAVEHISEAKDAEEAGLEALEKILKKL